MSLEEERIRKRYNDLLLLVEDSDADYEATMRGFKKARFGNEIFRCVDGDDALDYLYRRNRYEAQKERLLPGLILLDLNMPGTDGKEVLKVIKQDEELKIIPVIVLTSSSDERDIHDCYRLGANSYIVKPVGFEGLMEALKRIQDYWFKIVLRPHGY